MSQSRSYQAFATQEPTRKGRHGWVIYVTYLPMSDEVLHDDGDGVLSALKLDRSILTPDTHVVGFTDEYRGVRSELDRRVAEDGTQFLHVNGVLYVRVPDLMTLEGLNIRWPPRRTINGGRGPQPVARGPRRRTASGLPCRH